MLLLRRTPYQSSEDLTLDFASAPRKKYFRSSDRRLFPLPGGGDACARGANEWHREVSATIRPLTRRTGFAFAFCDVITVLTRLLGELHRSSFMVMGGARVVRYHVSSWMQRKNTRTSPSSHVISSPELWSARHEPSQADGVAMIQLPRLKKWNR